MIELINVSKSFARDIKVKTALGSIISKNKNHRIKVLKNINLSIKSKEVLGVIGPNGCGKSTLLKLIAEILIPCSGKITANGSKFYLSSYNNGLQGRLTMRENIYFMANLLGLKNKHINQKYQAIVAFSELEEFQDTRIYQFSSGMIARLAFSITVHCMNHQNPDILLLDEVFEAGADIYFKEKSRKFMSQFINKGSTVLIVSHNPNTILQNCTRVIWLKEKKIFQSGDPKKIISEYSKCEYK